MAAAARVLGVSAQTVRNMANDGRLPCYRLPSRGHFRRFHLSDVLAAKEGRQPGTAPAEAPSYHDLHITTASIPRTSIFNLPYGLEVTCTRTGGWQLWDMNQMQEHALGSALPRGKGRLLAGEYDGTEKGLRLDVAGHVICDSLTPPKDV